MKKSIIYLYPSDTSFIRKDIEFLSKEFIVLDQKLNWGRKSNIIPNLLFQFIFLIRNILRSKMIIVMFGGYWSFLPSLIGKIFDKPVFIILGGADCVSFPEYNYGSIRKPVLKRIIKWSYQLADRLLPVADTLVKTDYSFDLTVKEKKQGFLNFFPGLKTPHTVIYNGFDAEYWNSVDRRPNSMNFTTIAKVEDCTRLRVKGIDFVIEIARHFPEQLFHIVGMSRQFASSLDEIPANIVIHDFMSASELRDLLLNSRFYLQLSISEGFPNALCEAMLCECIPVGSNVGAIPFIINDSGEIIEHKDANLAVSQISRMIAMTAEELEKLGAKARQNISGRFPINNREKAMLELIYEQIQN